MGRGRSQQYPKLDKQAQDKLHLKVFPPPMKKPKSREAVECSGTFSSPRGRGSSSAHKPFSEGQSFGH